MKQYAATSLAGIMVMMVVSLPKTGWAFDYSFVRGGWQVVSTDVVGSPEPFDGTGGNILLSVRLSDQVSIRAGYSSVSQDAVSSSVGIDGEIKQANVSFLYHASLIPNADFYIGPGLVGYESDIYLNNQRVDAHEGDGPVLTLGVRLMAIENLELDFSTEQSYVNGNSDSSLVFSGALHISPRIAFDLSMLRESSYRWTALGIRYDL